MVEGAVDGNIPPATANRDNKLDLVMEIGGSRRIRHGCPIRHDRIGRLLEEEWRIALVRLLHFTDVFDVVATDAVDAPDWKPLVRTRDGQRYDFRIPDERAAPIRVQAALPSRGMSSTFTR